MIEVEAITEEGETSEAEETIEEEGTFMDEETEEETQSFEARKVLNINLSFLLLLLFLLA